MVDWGLEVDEKNSQKVLKCRKMCPRTPKITGGVWFSLSCGLWFGRVPGCRLVAGRLEPVGHSLKITATSGVFGMVAETKFVLTVKEFWHYLEKKVKAVYIVYRIRFN